MGNLEPVACFSQEAVEYSKKTLEKLEKDETGQQFLLHLNHRDLMKSIYKTSLVSIILLVISYAPFMPIGLNLDFNINTTSLSNNVIQSISIFVIPTTALLASLIVSIAIIRDSNKSSILTKVIMIGVLLSTVFIAIDVNRLTNEEKMLKVFDNKKDFFIVGKTYFSSTFVEQSNDKAITYFRDYLTDRDLTEHLNASKFYVAEILTLTGSLTNESFTLLSTLSQRNSNDWFEPKVYDYLGIHYYRGYGIEQDYAEALTWFRKSAAQGNPDAHYNLGFMFQHGQGVGRDSKQAYDWFQKAADIGHISGLYKIANMHLSKGNFQQMSTWSQKATEQENIDPQYNVGIMISDGNGLEKNNKQTIDWYLKAAELGYSDAQYIVGFLYSWEGYGLDAGPKQSVYWFQKAAEQGYTKAQYILASMYEEGIGVEKSHEKAIYWLQKAKN